MDRIYRIPQFGARVGRSAHPLRFLSGGDVAPQGLTVVCCRVSGRGQQDDLKRQVSAMEAYGPGAGVGRGRVAVGSRGRPAWQAQGVPVAEGAHREEGDRLSAGGSQGPSDRFGFDWFEHFAQQHGCTITVVNQESLSPQEAVVEDPMTVVHAFSCRLYGLRAYRKPIRDAANHG